MDISDLFYGSVTVGERGQIVIPAEARAYLNIKPGDRLIVMRDPAHQCISIGKLDHMRAVLDQYEAMFKKFTTEHAETQTDEA